MIGYVAAFAAGCVCTLFAIGVMFARARPEPADGVAFEDPRAALRAGGLTEREIDTLFAKRDYDCQG